MGSKNLMLSCAEHDHFYNLEARPRGYKTFFMLNSTEHEISTAHKKLQYRHMTKFLALSLSDVIFIMPINVKMPTLDGILTFMSRINIVLSWVEHKKSLITLMPGYTHTLINLLNIADYKNNE